MHDAGKNWTTDLTPQQKNGTFLIQGEDGISEWHDILPSYESINAAVGTLLKVPSNAQVTGAAASSPRPVD